jgi:RNA polymerase sigma factor FliA
MSSTPHASPATSTTDEDALVREFMPVVQHLVAELGSRIPRHVPREDLVSAGMYGLAQAARSWEPDRGVPFARHATNRVRGALLDELRSRDWASRSVRRDARRVQAADDAIQARTGRSASRSDIAAEMGVEVDEIERIVGDVHRSTVLSYQGIAAGYDGDVADILPDAAPTPAEVLLERERQAYLMDAVVALPERLRHVIVGYFFEERPMAELAAELEVTESRISQMCSEAMVLMRGAMHSQLEPSLAAVDPSAGGRKAKRTAAYYATVATASSAAQRLSAPAPLAERLAPMQMSA